MEGSTTAEEKGSKNMNPDLISMEMRRWLVVGIFLHNVLIPPVREIINKVMPEYYKRMAERHELDRQTFGKHKKRLGGVKVNYESINNNKDIKGSNPSSQYDYRVKDPVSLAKLFMEPRMAKFSAFDDKFEASATMAVLAGVEEFESVRSEAEILNTEVRVPWAHPIFRHWTGENYKNCFQIMENLVKRFFQSEDQKDILVQLEFWKTQGLKICLGNPLNDVLRKEVEALRDMLTKYQETTGVETKIIRQTLDLFKREVHEAFIKLRNKQSCLEQTCLAMERGLKEWLRSEMQKFEQQISSVHERIDGLDGKIGKLSERMERETAGKMAMERGLKKWLRSEMQKFEQQISSVHERIDGLDGKIEKLSKGVEKQLQPNEELVSAVQSRRVDLTSALD